MLKIVLFPPSRRIDLIRHIVTTARTMPTAWRREQYWRSRVAFFRKKMLETGMRPRDVERELVTFRNAVAFEAKLRAKSDANLAPSIAKPQTAVLEAVPDLTAGEAR